MIYYENVNLTSNTEIYFDSVKIDGESIEYSNINQTLFVLYISGNVPRESKIELINFRTRTT